MARPKSVKDGERMNIFLPAETKIKLRRIAVEGGISVSALIVRLVAAMKG